MVEDTLENKAAEIRAQLDEFLDERLKDTGYPQPTIRDLSIRVGGSFTTAAIELNPNHTEGQAATARHIISRHIANNGPHMILDFDPNGPPKTGSVMDTVQPTYQKP